jgi:hypothetical protein
LTVTCKDCAEVGEQRTATKIYRADTFEGMTLLIPLCADHHAERVTFAATVAIAQRRAANYRRGNRGSSPHVPRLLCGAAGTDDDLRGGRNLFSEMPSASAGLASFCQK